MPDVAAPAYQLRPARHGRGLFAVRTIAPRETILQLSGREYDGATLERVGFTPGYPLQVGEDRWLVLDAPAVFCNHSCEANAGIRADLQLIALRAIEAGEEICFDYSTTMLEHNAWTLDCGCGSPRCRGRVEDFDRLPPIRQRELLALGVVQPFIVEQLQRQSASTVAGA
jgi:hypothetical protein